MVACYGSNGQKEWCQRSAYKRSKRAHSPERDYLP